MLGLVLEFLILGRGAKKASDGQAPQFFISNSGGVEIN
jgi:hypothetical protein